jgi:prophage maintenance system killer protein
MVGNGEIIIYQTEDGTTEIETRLQEDTVWLTQAQIVQLFDSSKANISEHIKAVFVEGELNSESTVRKFRTVQKEGSRLVNRNIDHFNLDVIISVGYKVKSKRGTQFRIWANKVLKEYLIKGYSLNEKLLKEQTGKMRDLHQAIKLVSSLSNQGLFTSHEHRSLIYILEKYSEALHVLDNYDYQKLNVIKKTTENAYILNYDEVVGIIDDMRKYIGNSALFGKQKDESLKSSIAVIYQTFDGKELYPIIEEKAANLLYFLVKNHSFIDGNKRIAAAVFVYFLEKNNLLVNSTDSLVIDNSSLVALTLMIANSDPHEKAIIINIVSYLLQSSFHQE